MVIASPMKPSSTKMVRVKKQQPQPSPLTRPRPTQQDGGNDANNSSAINLSTLDIFDGSKQKQRRPVPPPKRISSGGLLASLARRSFCNAAIATTNGELSEENNYNFMPNTITVEIRNDEDGSESMQVILRSPLDPDDKQGIRRGLSHSTTIASPSSYSLLRHKNNDDGKDKHYGNCNSHDGLVLCNYYERGAHTGTMTSAAASSGGDEGGGGGRRKSSKLGLFKRGGSSGEGNDRGGSNHNNNNSNGGGEKKSNDGNSSSSSSNNNKNNNNNNEGSGDSSNNNDKKDKAKEKKNKGNKDGNKPNDNVEDGEEDDNNTSEQQQQPNSNDNNPTCPSQTTIFNASRIEFAHSSTLPKHTSSESTAPTTHPSWTPVDGTEFKVRTGPNYPKNGKKIASSPSLYEVYAVRYFRSERRTVGGATRIMPLPEMTPPRTKRSVVSGGGGGIGGKEEMDVSTILNGNPFKPLASSTRSSIELSAVKAALNESVTDGTTTTTTQHGAAATFAAPDGMLPSGNKSHPEFKGTKIPDVLVVHFMLPYEPPNMFKQKDDGKGGECVYYLRPSQRFLDEISGKVPSTAATNLFVRWCNECESDFQMRSRFKCMALVRDIEKHNMGLLKSYNGKPVLITESGRVFSGYHGDIRYVEMTANVHNWAFMAKKGFVSLIPKFESMQMEVGFTIEAHADSEMPECMLGSTVLSYISELTGPIISAEMQEPVHEHQS